MDFVSLYAGKTISVSRSRLPNRGELRNGGWSGFGKLKYIPRQRPILPDMYKPTHFYMYFKSTLKFLFD